MSALFARLRSWRARVILAGLVLILASWSVLAVLAAYEYRDQIDHVGERNDLLARVFADAVTRDVDAASQAGASLAALLARGVAPDGPEMRASLAQLLVNLPYLRGAAIVDAEGRIVGSTAADQVGRRIAPQRLGDVPGPDQERLGRWTPGRDLLAEGPVPRGVGFLPLLRGALTPDGTPRLLVLLIHPQAFATAQEAGLEGDAATALLSYDGRLIAATSAVAHPAGTVLGTLAPFSRFLPAREHGAWTGDGLRPGTQMASFRVSASRPLVVVVESAQSAALAGWRRLLGWLLGAGVLATALTAGLTAVASRSLAVRQAALAGREQAQQRLAAELAFTELLMDNSPLPMSLVDADGRYRRVNRAWEQFTGRPRAQVIGRPVGAHLQPAERQRHEEADRALRADGRPQRYEASALHADGTLRDILVGKVLLPGEGGAPGGILSVLTDVTDFRRAERAVREARDAAEEASRSKSEFVANISHELRTPLQSILGFSELGMVRGRQHEKLAGMFADIHASGQRMLNLVNDLLDVSKIESTVGTIHLERTDLRGLVAEVLRELDPLVRRQGLAVDLHLPEQPLVAKVDPLRLQQVLRNVIANALKFSPAGSRIRVHGRYNAAGEPVLTVRDRGPGIPEGELERIFEAFVQSSRTKDGSGGTGLGLAICRKILAAHGGTITAANADGGGAVFHIVLPARGQAETQPMPL